MHSHAKQSSVLALTSPGCAIRDFKHNLSPLSLSLVVVFFVPVVSQPTFECSSSTQISQLQVPFKWLKFSSQFLSGNTANEITALDSLSQISEVQAQCLLWWVPQSYYTSAWWSKVIKQSSITRCYTAPSQISVVEHLWHVLYECCTGASCGLLLGTVMSLHVLANRFKCQFTSYWPFMSVQSVSQLVSQSARPCSNSMAFKKGEVE